MRRLIRGKTAAAAFVFSLLLLSSGIHVSKVSAQERKQLLQAYQELFDRSQKEKKGLTFYVSGQTIGGVFVKLIGNEAVEVRNQTHSRIIIRLDMIEALAIN